VISINPNFKTAFYNKGIVLQRMGQTEQALACLDKAVIIDKSFAEAHYRRGLLLKELGKTKIALLSF